MLFKKTKSQDGRETLVQLLPEHFDIEKKMYSLFQEQPLLIEDELQVFAIKYKIPDILEEIDQLAVDADGNIVVIEVKKAEAKNVLEQGLSYAQWVRDNIPRFQLLANEYFSKKALAANDPALATVPEMDKKSVRLIIVAEKISDKLRRAAQLSQIPVDLVEIKRYKNEEETYYSHEYVLQRYEKKIQIQTQKHSLLKPTLFKGKIAAMKPIYDTLLQKTVQKFQPNGDFTFEEKTKSIYIAFYREGSRFLILMPHQERIRVLARLADRDLEGFQPEWETPVKWEVDTFSGFNVGFNLRGIEDVKKYFPVVLASYNALG